MPDRDIFDVTVPKGWRAAARVAIAQDCVGEIGEAIETKMVRALKREAIETRLPGFGEVVEIVTRYLASQVPADYYSVDDELRTVRARYPWSSTTAVLCESAKRCISGGRPIPGRADGSPASAVQIGVSILSSLAVARISPASLVNELSRRAGLQIGSLESRREALYARLCLRDEVTNMARRLHGSFDQSKDLLLPVRVRRPKVSQHRILTISLG